MFDRASCKAVISAGDTAGLARLQAWLEGLEPAADLSRAVGDVARAGVDIDAQDVARTVLRRAVATIGPAGREAVLASANQAVDVGATNAAGILIDALSTADEHHPRLHLLRGRLAMALGDAAAGATQEALAARQFSRRAMDRLAATNYRPRHVMVQLTRSCNLRCAMCGHPSWQNLSGMLSEELFDRIVAECLENSRPTLIFATAQGEPLLNKKAETFAGKGVDAGLTVNVATNGIPLTPQRSDHLAAVGVNEIQFSFAGYDAASYESIYIGGHFDTAVRNLTALIDALERHRSPTTLWVNGVIPADQPDFSERTTAFLTGLGVKHVALQPVKNFAAQNVGMQATAPVTAPRLCRIGAWYAGVYVDGTVTACGCLDSNGELAIGNLHEESLAQMRKGPRFQRILQSLYDGSIASHPLCGGCDQRVAPLNHEDLQFIDACT